MNTLEFLTRILPSQGVYYGVALPVAGGAPRHKAFQDLPALADFVATASKRSDIQFYHACAAYKEPYVQTGEKKQFRVAENQLTAKAFWVDLDVGLEKFKAGKGYLDKKTAILSIIKASRTFFPDGAEPLLVSSGYGVHAYWLLKDPIAPDQWANTAHKLKAALKYFGVVADPSRTADFASILRPVGSINRKNGAELAVRVLRDSANEVDAEEFDAALTAYLEKHPVEAELPAPRGPASFAPDLNSDLTSHQYQGPPVWAETIAEHCQQVRHVRDTGGEAGYDQWRGVIGIMKFCEDGEEVLHSWSSKAADYKPEETQARFDTWTTPPTTCAFFNEHNPAGCAGCVYTKPEHIITTPKSLGQRMAKAAPINFEKLADKAVTTELPAINNYEFIQTSSNPGQPVGLYRSVRSITGEVIKVPFSHTHFYPRTRIKGEGNKYSLAIRAHLPREGIKDFDIPQSALASHSDLQKALAEHQIVTTNNKDAAAHMQAYLKDWLEELKHKTTEQNTYQTFGWHDDQKNFLLGERLYHADGSVREVLVGQSAQSKVPDFPPPDGSLELWKEAIHRLYGAPNQLYRQFVLASCFATPLVSLCSDARYRGITLSIYGKSGLGKSTLVEAGLSAFGNDDRMSIKRVTGATLNARYLTLATYGSAPLLIDEVTNVLPDQLSDLCYGVSMGEEKQRLTVGKNAQVGFAETRRWATNLFLTSNSDLHAILKLHNNNSEAESVRMVQLDFDKEPRMTFDNQILNEEVNKFKTNRGVAGEAFLRYVVSHKLEVKALMAKWADRIKNDFEEPQYRFYRNHAECAMAALEVCVHLGIFDFNVAAIYAYMLDRYRTLSTGITAGNTMTPEEALNEMVTSYTEQIIVSDDLRFSRSHRLEDLRKVVRDPVGRYVIGGPDNRAAAGHLYMSIPAIREWCGKNRMDYNAMIEAAKSTGVWVELKDSRFYLGKGTTQITGQTRVICIDYPKMLGLLGIEGTVNADGTVTKSIPTAATLEPPGNEQPPEDAKEQAT